MIDAAIRARFEKVRKLKSSPNAGEASAASARWDAMVAKYGDPDVRVKPDSRGSTIDYGQYKYTALDIGDIDATIFAWMDVDLMRQDINEQIERMRRAQVAQRRRYHTQKAADFLARKGFDVVRITDDIYNISGQMPGLHKIDGPHSIDQMIGLAKTWGWRA